MFDWIRFIDLAKILIEMDDEESIRTAISRLYYGFFGVVRRYLICVKHKYHLMSKSADIHSKVYNELRFSNDGTEKAVGEILNDLRVARNHADYDGEDKFDEHFFRNFLKEKNSDLICSFDSLKYLKNHPNY